VSSQYCGLCRAEHDEDDFCLLCDDCYEKYFEPTGEQLVDQFNRLMKLATDAVSAVPFDAKVSLKLHFHINQLKDNFSSGWPLDGKGSNSVRMQGR